MLIFVLVSISFLYLLFLIRNDWKKLNEIEQGIRHAEIAQRHLILHPSTANRFKEGDKVILTEQDETYSIGIVEDIGRDFYNIRLIESTHYPAGTFENHIYHASPIRLKPYKGD